MPRINLLPWREELAKQRKKEFGILMGIAAAVGAIIAVMWHFYSALLIYGQDTRVRFLTDQIALQDKKIEEIRALEETRGKLVSRMHAIEGLQRDRPIVVRFFDELQKSLPDGGNLTVLSQKENIISIEGRAESNARVSAFMRNLEKSAWLTNPRLKIVERKAGEKGDKGGGFKLKFSQVIPKVEDEFSEQDNSSKKSSP